MREPVLRLLTVLSAQPRSRLCRVLATCAGGVVVLGLAPLLLALVGGWAAGRWPSLLPRGLELTFGVLSVLDGLCLLLWATLVLWRIGGGTPSPAAATRRLVVDGPYAYCRNPILLGALLYYLGVGCLWISFNAGVVMFLLGLVLGTAYHKGIEEEELRRRFGTKYEAYRLGTPFLFPRLVRPRRRRVSP
jgi:protein-S-isoprenylcysteine O-methyltransferase Ste14